MSSSQSEPEGVNPPSGPQRPGGIVEAIDVDAWYGAQQALKRVNITFDKQAVTAIIGPSGCGKSTLIRTINRMHELVPKARFAGRVLLDGSDVYAPGVNVADIRRRIGMVFQKPNPFPNLSIRDNVVAGLKQTGRYERGYLDDLAHESLEKVSLWDEVKDKLHHSGASLSGGQQQRLCIARAISVKPEVILMDEPCSALDPIATAKVEELIVELKKSYTVIVVTHNLQQAARISEKTAFMYLGRLVEYDQTTKIFQTPKEELTQRYVMGKFG